MCSFTYAVEQLTARDQVRLYTGDVIESDHYLEDEEIDLLLKKRGSVLRASVAALQAIISRVARQVDYTQADMHESLSQRLKGFQEAMIELRSQLATTGGGIYAGGVTLSDKQQRAGNTALAPPVFSRGMDTIRGTEPYLNVSSDSGADGDEDDIPPWP